MPKVIGVKFRTSPRVYYFAPLETEEYPKNSVVVVETQRGTEFATVVSAPHDVDDDKIVAPLKSVLRRATEAELRAAAADEESKREILATAKQKVAARGLDMKIVDCEFTVDHSKLVLYFTAEQRVDFRELVRDLAAAFKMRIDLRQIGARDECKLIGSLGPCGMQCCCGRFESDSEHVSIKMAKTQNLALTPGKINGMCGRLLCCLAYESKTYEELLKKMPKHGTVVTTADGRRGTVVSVTPLTEKVRVRFGTDENFEFAELPLAELTADGSAPKPEQPKKSDGARSDRPQQQQQQQPRRDRQDRNKNRNGNNDRNGNNAPEQKAQSDNGNNGGGHGKNKNKNRHRRNKGNGNGGGNSNNGNNRNNSNNGNNGGKPAAPIGE